MTGLRQLNDDLGTRTSELIERLHVSRGTGRMLVLLVVAFVFFAALRPNVFLSTLNLQNLALSAPEVGVLAIAMMLAMLTGGIDLSLVNIANLSAITMSTLYTTIHGSNPALAEQLVPVLILAGLGMGLLGGADQRRARRVRRNHPHPGDVGHDADLQRDRRRVDRGAHSLRITSHPDRPRSGHRGRNPHPVPGFHPRGRSSSRC